MPERKVAAEMSQLSNKAHCESKYLLVSLPATIRRAALLSISCGVILAQGQSAAIVERKQSYPFSSLYLRMYDMKSTRSVPPRFILSLALWNAKSNCCLAPTLNSLGSRARSNSKIGEGNDLASLKQIPSLTERNTLTIHGCYCQKCPSYVY